MNGPRRTELAEQPAVISLPHLGIQTTGGSGFEMTPMSRQAAVARGPVSAGPLCAHTAVRVDGTLPSTYPGERDLHTADLAELRTDDGVVTVEPRLAIVGHRGRPYAPSTRQYRWTSPSQVSARYPRRLAWQSVVARDRRAAGQRWY
jgi:hypothetical protein